MNYQKKYNNIIENAILQNRLKHDGILYENHHIIPKCMGGTDAKENLVLLTLREHFVCHKLLVNIYPKNTKLLYAFFMMASLKHKKSSYKVSSREFARLKEQIHLYLTSEEVKEKRKETIFKKKFSPEKIENYLESLKSSRFVPSNNSKIYISTNTYEQNKETLQNKIEDGANNDCYIRILKNCKAFKN